MKGKKASEGPTLEHGIYEAELEAINCYIAENFRTKDPEVNLTFIWNLGEDDEGKEIKFYDGFVTLHTDNDGFPVMGGSRSKLFNRVSALYGERFDPKVDDFDWEIAFQEEYDDPEALITLPHWETLKDMEEEDKPVVESLQVYGKELIGLECQIEVGNAERPDGKKSERTSVINANPMPKTKGRPRRKADKEDQEDALPV